MGIFPMNDRQRFQACMHYQPRDRSPLYDFNYWDETVPAWHEQGLPKHVNHKNAAHYFGLDVSIAVNDPHDLTYMQGIYPLFDEIVLEDRGEYELAQQNDGVRVLRKKHMGTIPMHEGHLLVDRESWRKHYKPRLNPDTPGRLPKYYYENFDEWMDPNRPYSLRIMGGSLYGWIRNWMGVEAVSLLVYDDPALFEEMVETLANCSYGILKKILETGLKFDSCGMWEDMCFKAGPLLSPEHFKQFLLPRYRRITDLLRSYGVDVIWVDSDGDIDKLIPLWMEGGVNCMIPIEVGTWGGDPVAMRKKYGKELLLVGGFDKKLLAKTKEDIEREVRRLAPLVEEGGYIPLPDHMVPPDVPLENFLFYAKTIREVWGQGVNLRPVDWSEIRGCGAAAGARR
jgi:uroporphyrinogen decarboxylase